MKINLLKFLKFKINDKILGAIIFLGMILLFLPILIIAIYNHPCADDFTYGFYTHAFWYTDHSITETLKWAIYTVTSIYDTWQGTFSSAFLMSLSPAVFNERFYWITTYFLLFFLGLSVFYMFKVLLKDVLKISGRQWIMIAASVLLLIVEQMHWPAQGIFWYNASIHYVFMQSMLFLFISHLIRILQTSSTKKLALFYFLSVLEGILVSGGNYVSVLTGLIVIAIIVFLGCFIEKKKTLKLSLPVIVFILGSAYSMMAPGNEIRGAYFQGLDAMDAITNSFITSARAFQSFFTIFFLLLLLMMIPTIWNMLGRTEFTFPLPGIVMLISFCMFSAMYTPSYYATGEIIVARGINIIKMSYQILVFLNVIYIMGNFKTKLKKQKIAFILPQYFFYYVTLALLILFFFSTSTNREGEYISYGAYASLVTGQAKEYDEQYKARLEILESDEDYIDLQAFTVKPFLLYVDDITSDPTDWRNNAMKNFYFKEEVILISE